MGVAVQRAPVSNRSPEHLKSSVTGPSLLVNCYLQIKFHKKIRVKVRVNIRVGIRLKFRRLGFRKVDQCYLENGLRRSRDSQA